MSREAQAELKLRELLDRGALPSSACSGALRQMVTSLIDAGVLAWKASGAGKRLVVLVPGTLSAFITNTYPQSAEEAIGHTSSRATGVARFRDSKALRNDMREIVCVRSLISDVLRCNGEMVEVPNATGTHGLFAFALGGQAVYSLQGICALIENPAVFLSFETLGLPVELAIHGRGRCSNRLLDWLAAQTSQRFQLWHLPDYDPVGLDEFERVRARIGERARLHLPANLAELFQTFSKRELLANTTAQILLARLRSSVRPEVREVVALIDRHNAGLEQEALLI